MEWARETAKSATNSVLSPASNGSDGEASSGDASMYQRTKDTASQVYDKTKDTATQAISKSKEAAGSPGDTASAASDQASAYLPNATNEKTVTSAVINSAPFNSFKPDPSTVWKGHVIYFILAAACTLPWWAFIFAADYFQYLYPDTLIIRLFVLAYFLPWVITYLLVINFWREGSSWIKINVGGVISIVAVVVICLLDGIFMGDKGTTATFWITLAAVAIAGAGDAISQGSLLGISSELPESFTKAYSCGSTASGVFVFLVRVITKASLSDSSKGLRISGIIYFSVCAFFVVLALALFAYVHFMPEMGYYNSLNLGSFETIRLLIQDEGTVTIEVASGAAIAAVAAGRSSPANALDWKSALDHVKFLAIAAFLTPLLTFFIFPGVLAEDIPHWPKLGDYTPLLLLGTFVVSDLGGRLFTIQDMPQRHSSVFGLAWLRLFLAVFFIFALIFDELIVSSVILMMFLAAVLGFSNGYLISTLTVLVPKATPSDLAETAGILNTSLTNVGVVVGAALSWGAYYLLHWISKL